MRRGRLGLVEPTASGRLWRLCRAARLDGWPQSDSGRLSGLAQRRPVEVRLSPRAAALCPASAHMHTAVRLVCLLVSLEASAQAATGLRGVLCVPAQEASAR